MSPIAPLGQLALAWLTCREGGAGSASDLRKALAGFARLAAPGALAEALTAVEGAGLVTRARGKLTLTDDGRDAAARFLAVPAGTRPQWKQVSGPALVDKLLELPPAKRDSDGLRAAVIAREHGLPADAGKTLGRAADALGWKLLGIDRGTPFTRAAVLVALAERELGAAGRDLPATLRLLAARAVGGRRGDARELRDAVLRRWLGGAVEEAAQETPAEGDRDGLAGFAARVTAAARSSPTGWFGDNKVFISHVARAMGEGDLEGFKQRLVEAHQGGLLSLSRADLIEAMDPDDVRASETHHLSATYHFIRLEERPA